MDTQQQGRPTGQQRERTGAIYAVLGLIAALAGFGLHVPAVVLIGVLVTIGGAIMWGAGMARRD